MSSDLYASETCLLQSSLMFKMYCVLTNHGACIKDQRETCTLIAQFQVYSTIGAFMCGFIMTYVLTVYIYPMYTHTHFM